jgi:acyl carrier protein
METAKVIKEWIENNVSGARQKNIDFNTALNDARVLDSLMFIELLVFCENRFSIKFPPDKITPQNFKSINTIAALLQEIKNNR